jgi:thimet oligopeptidase
MGATSLAGFSGCAVKKDFVEMPSQMLESWMYDPEILKMVSSHYKTKQPLSDAMIKKIRENKNFDIGDFINGQLMYAHASLRYFLSGNTDVDTIWHSLNQRFRPYITSEPADKFYASMGHLANYGASYYGYLWSQVYALDLFNYIEKYGLLDRTIGERYICQVIGKGGSEDPADMLKKFLGREPNSDAFFKDLGL